MTSAAEPKSIRIPKREEMEPRQSVSATEAVMVEPTLREKFSSFYVRRSQLRDLPRAEPLVDGVLQLRGYHVLRGRDSTYKSFLALDWALSIATGTPWNGRAVQQAQVLYITGEGVEGLEERIAAWEADHGVEVADEDFEVRHSALNMYQTSEDYDELLKHVEDEGFGLVVIDTLRRVTGGADENASQMGVVIDNIAQVQRAAPNNAVLVIAHTTKKDDDSRGFSAIEDDADVVWATSVDKDSVLLRNIKTKNGPKSPSIRLGVRRVEGAVVLSEKGPGRPLSQDVEFVYDQIKENPGKNKGSYRTRAGKPAYRQITGLIEKGYVTQEKRGTEQIVCPKSE